MQAAGAQRGADSEFLAAIHGARQQQIGHVGTGNQQQEADCGEEHQQKRPNVADNLFAQASHGNRNGRFLPGIFSGQLAGDAGHLGPGLRQSYAGSQASNHVQPAGVAGSRGVRVGVQRNPDGHDPGGWILKILRQDTDHRDRLVVERNDPADDFRVSGEIAAPEIVA